MGATGRRAISSDGVRRLVPYSAVVLFAALAWQRRWMAEDGFINLRIVDQVVAGHGPVFNAGQRVEAFTSPLWLAILVVLRALLGWAVPMEWLAVVAGIALAVTGLALACAGAIELQTARRGDRDVRARWYVPAGALVVVAIPPMWDFASSGLETGLALGWIGACAWALARLARIGAGTGGDDRPPWPWPTAVLLGLGPLVRPELTLYSVSFAVVAWRLTSGGRRARARTLLALLAAPLAYQVFRMGYYASLVPNTALAKDAGRSELSRGLRYLGNFVSPYELWLPLLLLVGIAAVTRPWRANRSWTLVVVGLVAPALLQVAYVVWVGGDYMHGRFFVIPLLALVAPVAVVPLRPPTRTKPVQAALCGAVALWAVVAATTLRTPLQDVPVSDDARRISAIASAHAHPVMADQQPYLVYGMADRVRKDAAGDRLVTIRDMFHDELIVVPRARGTGPEAALGAIGVVGYELGPDVPIIDVLGLADPVAARIPVSFDVRAGHTRELTLDWVLAIGDARGPLVTADARAGRRALACGDLGRLLDDLEQPLTPGRFLGNLLDSPANTTLKVPTQPTDAEREFCR